MSDVFLGGHQSEQAKLLHTVAEDLKTPLLQILTRTQLSSEDYNPTFDYIETTAQAALRLVDSYILSTQIYNGQQRFAFEPTSVNAAIYDSVQYLSKLAKLYDSELEVRVSRHLQLAMANPAALKAIIASIGYSFLHAVTNAKKTKQKIVLTASGSSDGIKTGVYARGVHLSSEDIRRATFIKGEARQLFPELTHGSSAGIVIAQSLCEAMDIKLRTGKFRSMQGLVFTLVPSRQLAFL